MSVRGVVITRPAGQAQALAERVAALGRRAIVFPLLEILPLDDPAPLREVLAGLRDYAIAAFVSPNAIDAAFAFLPEWPREVAIAVVGEGSRLALARHGIREPDVKIHCPRDAARSDSEGLLDTLDPASLQGARVLIVRGETGREFLADALRAAGAQVTPVAAYRRRAPELNEEGRARLKALLDSDNDWVITSSEALRHLVRMAREVSGERGVAGLQRQRIVCPHARIAETARELGLADVILAGTGDERLLAALQSRP